MTSDQLAVTEHTGWTYCNIRQADPDFDPRESWWIRESNEMIFPEDDVWMPWEWILEQEAAMVALQLQAEDPK